MHRNSDLADKLDATLKRELSTLAALKTSFRRSEVANRRQLDDLKKPNSTKAKKANAEIVKVLAPFAQPYTKRASTSKKAAVTDSKPKATTKELAPTMAPQKAATEPMPRDHTTRLKNAAYKGPTASTEKHVFEVIKADDEVIKANDIREKIGYFNFDKSIEAKLGNIKAIIFREPISIDQLTYIVNFLRLNPCPTLKAVEILGTVYRSRFSRFDGEVYVNQFAQNVSQLLTSPFSLKELFIEENNRDEKRAGLSMSDQGCFMVGRALKHNKGLRKFTLQLKKVDYSEKGYDALIEAVRFNNHLKNFPKYDLDGNALTLEEIKSCILINEENGNGRAISAPNQSKKPDPTKWSLKIFSKNKTPAPTQSTESVTTQGVVDKSKLPMGLDRI